MRILLCCLTASLLILPASAQKTSKPPKVAQIKEAKLVYPDGKLYHVAGCPKIPAGSQGITRDEAKLKKLHACPICKKNGTGTASTPKD